RSGVDEAAHADALQDAIEIAVEGHAEMREQVERAEPRRLARLIDADLAPDLPDELPLAVPLAQLPGEEEELAHADERHVVGARLARFAQLDPLRAEAFLDLAARSCLGVEADGTHADPHSTVRGGWRDSYPDRANASRLDLTARAASGVSSAPGISF